MADEARRESEAVRRQVRAAGMGPRHRLPPHGSDGGRSSGESCGGFQEVQLGVRPGAQEAVALRRTRSEAPRPHKSLDREKDI